MEYSLVLLLLGATLLAKLLFVSGGNARNKKLPPSPPSLPVIGHLHLFEKPLHRALAAISARYGPVVLLRFGTRTVLSVASPDVAEECFTKNDVIFANRPHLPSQKELFYDYYTLGVADYGPLWRTLRRVTMSEVLSNHKLLAYSVPRTAEVHYMVRQLFRDWKSVAVTVDLKVELRPRLFQLSLNVMMMMIVGKRYDMEDVRTSEEAKKFIEIVQETLSVSGASNIVDFLPNFLSLGFKGTKKKLLEYIKR